MNRLGAIAILALAVAGCGSGSDSSSSTTASAPSAQTTPRGAAHPTHVTIQNLAFSPAVMHAKVGQTITWANHDIPPHNVTWVSGPKFSSSPTMNPGATFKLKLTQPGKIHYFCSIHPFMRATIVVSR